MNQVVFGAQLERVAALWGGTRFFFVVGAPKSGTTWLQTALNSHPNIVCAGEGHFGDHLASKLARVFREYFDQQAIVERNVYEGRGHYRHKQHEDYDFLLTAAIVNAFTRVSIPPGTMFVGDKTPANVAYLQLFKRLFPGVKFLNIVRDGRDTLLSTFKHVERVMRGSASSENLNDFLTQKTRIYCERWVRSLDQADKFAQQNPGTLHTVRYEDLKADFAGSFARVLRFLGADDSMEILGSCEEASSFRRLSGGREAGQEDPNAFIRKGVVGDWQNHLTSEQLEIIYDVGAGWLERLGYEVTERDLAG